MRLIIFILILTSCSHLNNQNKRALASEDKEEFFYKICDENLPIGFEEDMQKCINQLYEKEIPLFKVVACSENTTHNTTFLTCLSHASFEEVSVEKIQACSDVTNFPGSWRNCLNASQQIYLSPEKILACGETIKTGFLFRICVETAGEKSITAARIRQCEGKGVFSFRLLSKKRLKTKN